MVRRLVLISLTLVGLTTPSVKLMGSEWGDPTDPHSGLDCAYHKGTAPVQHLASSSWQ